MSAWRRMFLLLVAGAALGACVPAQSPQKAPDLTLKDTRGRRIRLNDYHGKVVLLNFWATWCPPCRKEIPDLIRIQAEYRAQGLRVIGITYPPQSVAQVRRFVRMMRFNYPTAIGTKQTKAMFDESDVLPITVIIDRTGKVREVVLGILFQEEFAEKIKPLLLER
jgi:peroxiredoxin